MNSIWKVMVGCLIFFSQAVMAIEEPQYTVESKTDLYEIRVYGPTIVAETIIDAPFEEAGTEGFKILANYIFGDNRSNEKITMTAPVAQIKSEKIAMTAPVNQISGEKGYVVQFTMPAKFTMETLPQPNDKRVHIRQIPKRKVAVFAYSGFWSESRYKSKLSEFVSALKRDNIKTVGEPIFARFNSPFRLWFLRRNEIWFEISQ